MLFVCVSIKWSSQATWSHSATHTTPVVFVCLFLSFLVSSREGGREQDDDMRIRRLVRVEHENLHSWSRINEVATINGNQENLDKRMRRRRKAPASFALGFSRDAHTDRRNNRGKANSNDAISWRLTNAPIELCHGIATVYLSVCVCSGLT